MQKAYARRRRGHLYSRFNPARLLMVQEREKRCLSLLSRHGCSLWKVKNSWKLAAVLVIFLRDFIKWGVRPENIVGIDLLAERIAEAIHVCPKAMEIHLRNAAIRPSREIWHLIAGFFAVC
jgi:hypothetical protein